MSKKLLYIEDDLALVEVVRKRAALDGYEFAAVNDGEKALSVTIDFMPDIIVTGILMPKIGGFDVIDILKNTKETRHIPIIVLSAIFTDIDIIRGYKLGVSRYLNCEKTTVKRLFECISEVLDDQVVVVKK